MAFRALCVMSGVFKTDFMLQRRQDEKREAVRGKLSPEQNATNVGVCVTLKTSCFLGSFTCGFPWLALCSAVETTPHFPSPYNFPLSSLAFLSA